MYNNNFIFILYETLLHLKKDYLLFPLKNLTISTNKNKIKVTSKPISISSVIECLQGNAKLRVCFLEL